MPYLLLLLLGLLFAALSLSRAAARQRALTDQRWGDLERRLTEHDEAVRQLGQRLERLEQAVLGEPEQAAP